MDVLVVIDVQNCFMFHKDGMQENKGGTFLNAGQEASMDIVRELETLVDGKSHVVFSRDFHPMNHISLEGYEGRKIDPLKGIWPKHCRNKRVQCGSRNGESQDTINTEVKIPNNLVDTTTGELTQSSDTNTNTLEVIGTELSYMFFTSEKFRDPVKRLILDNREGKTKVGLADTMVENGVEIKITEDDATRILNYNELPYEYDGKKYISLTKGERCEKEAYSAFNYHIEYDHVDPAHPEKKIIPPNSDANSTGLWEWILKNRDGKNEITVTVCGLVGNVCVMHSLLQGIALWNNIYSKRNPDVKVKFVYSLKGTRFADAVPPLKVKPNFDDDKDKDEIVSWFNQPFNLPERMNPITLSEPIPLTHQNQITSFEVLNYEGKLNKIGTFGGKTFEVAEGAGASLGGMRRRSVRRRKNKSRKSQKRQKGRRTHKNKRRFTKRR
jgi:nicotinamidase-related amidase